MKPPSNQKRAVLTFHKRLPDGLYHIEVDNGRWSRFAFDSEDGQLEWFSKMKVSTYLIVKLQSSNWDPPLPDGMRW